MIKKVPHFWDKSAIPLSIGLYILSLTQPVLEGDIIGLVALMYGWILLPESLLLFLIWLGNFGYFIALFLLLFGKKTSALYFSICASLLATLFLVTDILLSESIGLGYPLWLSSFIVLSYRIGRIF